MRRIAALILPGLLLAACSSPAGGRGIPGHVLCEVMYRHDGLTSNQSVKVTTADPQKVQFADLAFEARYSTPQTESPALAVTVVTPDGQPVVNTLYQLDRTRPPVNQFAGGHGFTGLVYAFAPSGAELQFFCQTP